MTKHLAKLLQQVYNCDTEAGHRLRYIIMKALAYKPYAEHIQFHSADILSGIFLWRETLEGNSYWRRIWKLIYEGDSIA